MIFRTETFISKSRPIGNQSRAMSWTTSCCSLLTVGVVKRGSVSVVFNGSLAVVGSVSNSASEGLERGSSDVFRRGSVGVVLRGLSSMAVGGSAGVVGRGLVDNDPAWLVGGGVCFVGSKYREIEIEVNSRTAHT